MSNYFLENNKNIWDMLSAENFTQQVTMKNETNIII